jgi:hypothetical protein
MTVRWGWQPYARKQNDLVTCGLGWVPKGLVTRRQMRAEGLAPGGAAPVAQLVFHHRRRREVRTLLWDRAELVSKRVASPARLVALSRALAARRWCPSCERDVGYRVPTPSSLSTMKEFPDAA